MLTPDYTKQFFLSETVHTQTFFLNKKHDRRKKSNATPNISPRHEAAGKSVMSPRPSGGGLFWVGRISPSK
jgi:hypothetical protein